MTDARAQVVVGPNVNMGGGPATFDPQTNQIVGDPFLQRQNEPSIAVSSRNPCHLLAGANDYRAVDVEDAAGEVGDAWLGVFKSFDCGATWTSTLLPGHKLDTSAQGLASPIKGLAAAADPTVRAGTSGLFYYSGISFNRGANEPSKVFVARFVDNNNKDGGDPIQYLGATQIDLGTSGQFLDKPWIVADIPRNGSTCTVNGRSVPAGPAYLVYTSFVGGNNNVHSKILFSKSTDCGVTWSNPSKLSERVAQNQGTTIAIDPGTGAIHIAWREFAISGDSNSRNAILVVKSTDGGQTFTKASGITPNNYQFQPFDQASSPLTFRTNAYPTIAVVPAESEGRAAGQPGRVYVAWSARGFATLRQGQTQGDARIVMSSSLAGTTWTAPRITDPFTGAGHQIMPALAFAGGKVALAYYDLRDDASAGFDDLVFEYGQQPFNECMLSPGANTPLGFGAVLQCIVTNANRLSRRHTLDMRASMADGLCLSTGTCDLASTSVLGTSRKVSRYVEGRGTANGGRTQLQYNRPNLPIFSKGKFPFIGDYIDIAGQNFVATATGGWAWNTGASVNRPAPVFHVSWSDNRNVGTPRNTNWSQFTPPVLGPSSVACVPGQVGIRNQDVYTAELRPGLIVSSPQNSKRVAGLQRSFVVVARNTTDAEHQYVVRAQPPVGVIASFDQTSGFGTGAPVAEVIVTIPRKSSVSRTVFVGLENPPADPSAAPDVVVPVTVDQVPDGLGLTAFDMVYLNPDFENPDFENPDFENAELHNPDFENVNFKNPDFENPDFENFTLGAASSIRNPDFENPDYENPDFENPDFENPDFENPDFENPDYENPDFENPDFENPDFENPDFENPDFENGSFQVSDTTWPVRNNGNTTSAYKTNVYVNGANAAIRYQLVVRKIFPSPAAVCAVPGSPAAPLYPQSVPIVNIVHPNVATNPFNRDFNDPSRDNATFSLAPGERGVITLRAYCDESAPGCTRDLVASLQGKVALGIVAQGTNCVAGDNGNVDPVLGGSTCLSADGPPKDIYDPIPPVVAVMNPTITAPETILEATDTAANNGYGYESVSFSLSATDNVAVANVTCQAATTAVTLQSITGTSYQFAGVFPVGATGVTCTALDVRANPRPNAGSVSFLVNVKDVTPPSFNIAPGSNPGSPFGPGNPAEATGPNGAVVTYMNPPATDNNGGNVTVACGSTSGLVSGSTFPVGTTDINCTATDGSGNSTPPTNLFDITVADTTPPVVTLAGATTVTIEAGSPYVDAGASATDLVSGPRATTVSGAVNTFAPGVYTITYSATDSAGNTGTATRTITVADTTAPLLGAVSNISAEATSSAGAAVSYQTPAATDAVGVTSISCAPAAGGTFALGATTVTCTAADAALNTSSKTFAVTVVDTTPPVLTVPANIANVQATGPAGATVTYAATATDLVSAATVTCAPASGSTFGMNTTTVTCTATDVAGNTSAAKSFTVNVVDTTPPAFVDAAPVATAEATSSSGAIVTFSTPLATDAVGVASVACTPASGSTFTLGTTPVVCTATDAKGNSASTSGAVTVVDTTPPVLTVPANIANVQAAGPAGATVTYTTTATDLVSAATVACAPASGSTFSLNTTTVTCTATDAAGNSSAAKSFTVTVVDTTPPVLTVPANIANEQAAGPAGATVTYTATASDLVSAATVTCAPASGNTFGLSTTTVTCTATDAAGNTSAAKSFTVNVVDTTPPAFVGAAPVATAEATSSSGAIVTFSTPLATDAVGVASVACTPASGSTFTLGTTPVVCTATDAKGNATSTSGAVTVVDTTPPVVAAAPTVTAEATSAAGASVTFSTPSATDAVGVASVACTPASGSTFALGTTPVVCTATDAKGNSASTSGAVTVVDTTAPLVTVVGAPTSPVQGNTRGGAVITFTASATDLVSGQLTATCAPASGSVFAPGTTTVLCTATDGAGLKGSRTFSVTVIDTAAPVVTLIGSSPVTIEAGSTYADPGATATDLVWGPLSTSSTGTVNPAVVGTYTITYKATDGSSNSATATRTVSVVDTKAPVITAAATPPTLLWSPNKTMTPVTVTGKITDATLTSASYAVVDEYKKIQPAGSITVAADGSYSFVVMLEAYRNGNDADGRFYTITVKAVDSGNRSATASAIVTVPHNQ